MGRRISAAGFTLIEMTIVLVIIGLVVGGVLVGQDLVRASNVRAQVAQIDKYRTAVTTFRDKYGALPGDMNAATASQFGFTPRSGIAAQGDGNGIVEGYNVNTASPAGYYQSAGETIMFWVDLTTANGLNINMIDGSFSRGQFATSTSATSNMQAYYPQARIGRGNSILVYSYNNTNYYSLSVILSNNGGGYPVAGSGTMRVDDTAKIDAKVDDGLPTTGTVLAYYIAQPIMYWAGVNIRFGTLNLSNALPATATTCFDNGGNAGTLMQYSLGQSSGSGANCALSFQFQ